MGHKRMSDLPAILLAFSRVRSLRQAPAAVMLWASWPWPLTESAVIHPIIKYPSSKCSAYNSLNMNDLIQKLDDNAADLKHSIKYRARQYPSPTTVRSAFFWVRLRIVRSDHTLSCRLRNQSRCLGSVLDFDAKSLSHWLLPLC